MPKFQPQKRRTISDEDLEAEYRSENKQSTTTKKKKKTVSSKKKNTSKSASKKRNAAEMPNVEASSVQTRYRTNPEQLKREHRDSSGVRGKRKKHGRYTLYYVLCGIIITGALCLLCATVLFNISDFVVSGETVYSDEEIISACGIEAGENLLRINIGAAQERIISSLAYIDSVKIERGFPNRLIINVEAAKPIVCIYNGVNYSAVSAKGKLLEVSEEPFDCPLVTGFYSIIAMRGGTNVPFKQSALTGIFSLVSKYKDIELDYDEEKRTQIVLEIAEEMENQGLTEYYEINISDILNITINYDERVIMEIGASTNIEEKLYHAALLLEDEISEAEKCTLILSNPDRVVKRPIYENPAEETSQPEEALPSDEDGESESGDETEAPDEETE